MEHRRAAKRAIAVSGAPPHRQLCRCALLATASLALLTPFVSGCSQPEKLDPVTGRDMYAVADLVASGFYAKEAVVEQKLRANLSSVVISKIVNSTFVVKDVFASNSSPPGYCFPPTIVIRTTVVDGCVDLLGLWRPNASYVVVLRALDAGAGYYEMHEDYQIPFVDYSPGVAQQLLNVSCDHNQTCIAAHPSLCRAARLHPSPPDNEQQPPTDLPPPVGPTDLPPPVVPTDDGNAATQSIDRNEIGGEEGGSAAANATAEPVNAATATRTAAAATSVTRAASAAAAAATSIAPATSAAAAPRDSTSAAAATVSAAAVVSSAPSRATTASRSRAAASSSGGAQAAIGSVALVAGLASVALAGTAERTRR